MIIKPANSCTKFFHVGIVTVFGCEMTRKNEFADVLPAHDGSDLGNGFPLHRI
jgi:hypothetical protein